MTLRARRVCRRLPGPSRTAGERFELMSEYGTFSDLASWSAAADY